MSSTLEHHGPSNKYKVMDISCQDKGNNYCHLANMPPSRDSVAFTSTKGLLNGPGQNNCFLNSAVQVSLPGYIFHIKLYLSIYLCTFTGYFITFLPLIVVATQNQYFSSSFASQNMLLGLLRWVLAKEVVI